MAFDPTRTPGSFTPPPSNAPREVTDGTVPGDVTIVMPDGSTTSAARMARQYEQELPAYAPKPMTIEQMAAYLGKSVEEIAALQAASGVAPRPATEITPTKPVVDITPNDVTATKAVVLVDPNGSPISSQPAAQPVGNPRSLRHARPAISATAVDAVRADLDAAMVDIERQVSEAAAAVPPSSLADAARLVHQQQIDPSQPYRPAASNTDSPSRGIPTPAADLNKQITGGFGDGGEAQYYPLDGLEAGKVAIMLLESLIRRIPDDLRFSMALTYPRVRIRAVLEVECYAQDGSFSIEKKMVPAHERTPIEIARRHGDECCFCVIEQREEFDDDDQSVTPPNAMRLEVGVPVPRKHAVPIAGGRGRLLVDVDS